MKKYIFLEQGKDFNSVYFVKTTKATSMIGYSKFCANVYDYHKSKAQVKIVASGDEFIIKLSGTKRQLTLDASQLEFLTLLLASISDIDLGDL